MKKHLAARWAPADHLLLGADLRGQGRDRDRAPLQAERRRHRADGAGHARRPQGALVRRIQVQILHGPAVPGGHRARAAAATSQTGAPFAEERIEYILKTAANWSGPIKEFRLVVDKGDADNLVSFCGEDVKKIGDTQFEVKKTDFVPDGDLAILILKKLKAQ